MGLYFRKSVRVGPLRFNFSKSGIGVSAGIPGFRVGTGPRGNYVQMGAHGIYYRASLPSGAGARSRTPTPRSGVPHSSAGAPVAPPQDATLGPRVEIESGSVLEMIDETAADLLAELNGKRARRRWGPMVGWAAPFVLWLELSANLPVWIDTFVIVALIACWGWARLQDELRKTTVIMYDLDDGFVTEFQRLTDAMEAFRKVQRVWNVASEAAVRDLKYNAGASAAVERKPVRLGLSSPPFVKCNLDVPFIEAGRETLYFFPDRLLVFEGTAVGAVSYGDLRIERGTTRFIEESGVPTDSTVVGKTWQYVNKQGGPDRRFKDNAELPVVEYETLHLRSASGLNELFHASRVGAGARLEQYFASRVQSVATRSSPHPSPRPPVS